MNQFVEVAFPLPLSQTFTYEVPSEYPALRSGQRVLATLKKKKMAGFVVKTSTLTEFEYKPIQISEVIDSDPIIGDEGIALAEFLCSQYGIGIGQALSLLVPAQGLSKTKRYLSLSDASLHAKSEKKQFVIERIRDASKLSYEYFVKKHPGHKAILDGLIREGWVIIKEKQSRPANLKTTSSTVSPTLSTNHLQLNAEQETALMHIKKDLTSSSVTKPFLLRGVTGSGKTEIYLQATQATLEMEKKVLALVPEIALTPQFVERFTQRFGQRIAVFHSQIPPKKRIQEWNRVFQGEVDVVIGARSACFAPLSSIGLIIMDEEHDLSYKQEEGILYHALDVVQFRAKYHGASVVLGSATPRLESYHFVTSNHYQELLLNQRAVSTHPIDIKVIDVGKDPDYVKGQRLISSALVEEIAQTLDQRQQCILFLNRRGFCSAVFCSQCEQSIHCKRCSISLTYHKKHQKLRCHYCGYVQHLPQQCPSCNSTTLVPLGFGTEKLEKELQYYFPDAVIERMDRDRLRKKDQYQYIYDRLKSGSIDILVGTQMVTKGIDIPNVTLVGVLDADQSLHFPDFRSAEHTFDLLTQVIGRAGRGELPGKAVIQTLSPHHYAIQTALAQDYLSFYQKEIEFRKDLGYPPFSHLILFEMSSKDEPSLRSMVQWINKQCKNQNQANIEILGPSPAPVYQVNQLYRYHLLLRSSEFSSLHRFASWVYGQAKPAFEQRKIKLKMDIRPMRFM
ncbi:MAG: primosomal protein N' [Bdellovibrionota bacterium]